MNDETTSHLFNHSAQNSFGWMKITWKGKPDTESTTFVFASKTTEGKDFNGWFLGKFHNRSIIGLNEKLHTFGRNQLVASGLENQKGWKTTFFLFHE